MKSSSCTSTHLNWRRNSKRKMTVQNRLDYQPLERAAEIDPCYRPLLLSLFQVEALSMRSAFWSAESEALPQRRALWSAENEAKTHGKISNFPTFLLYLDYELLLRSLRSLRSNYELLLRSLRSLRSN